MKEIGNFATPSSSNAPISVARQYDSLLLEPTLNILNNFQNHLHRCTLEINTREVHSNFFIHFRQLELMERLKEVESTITQLHSITYHQNEHLRISNEQFYSRIYHSAFILP